MRTDKLIDILADAQQRQPRGAPWVAVSAGLTAGLAAALLLMTTTLGIRPDLIAALADPVVCLKLGFTVVVLLGAGMAARQLSLPGKAWRGAAAILFLAFAVLALWGLADLARRPVAEWAPCIMGHDWLTCLVAIPLLSLPTILAMGAGMRQLAPTRLRLAGTFLGLAAGGAASFAFTLYCQEDTVPFIVVWYSLALGISALLGRAIGPWMLRW